MTIDCKVCNTSFVHEMSWTPTICANCGCKLTPAGQGRKAKGQSANSAYRPQTKFGSTPLNLKHRGKQ